MTVATPPPPSLARWLLARTLPADLSQEVLGDLEQEYYDRPRGRALWYWRQAIGYAARFAAASAADFAGRALETFTQPGWSDDIRQARRSLARSRAFTATAVTILAIGLGSATAVFSLYHGILLRPFPYPSHEALVRVDWLLPTGQSQSNSLGDAALWARATNSFAQLGVFSTRPAEIRDAGPAEIVQATYVSSGTLAALGVSPQIGRVFEAEEDAIGGDVLKVVLGDGLWRRRFGGDAAVIGRMMRLGEQQLEVVGVMPPNFDFPNGTDLWVPVEATWLTTDRASSRRATVRIYGVIARLRPHVTSEQADDALAGLAREAARQHAQAVPRVRSLRESETGSLRPHLFALAGGVLCLLLTCVANVSSLQVARGAIQLVESLLLGLAGSVAGGAASYAVLAAIRSWIPVDLPSWIRLEVDGIALAFCVVVAVTAGAIAGLVPVWRASSGDTSRLLASGGRGATTRVGLRHALVTLEVGLSVVLLVGALLLMQTLGALQRRDPGFRTDGLLTVRVSRTFGDGSRLDRARVLPAMHGRVLERLAELPGVELASLGNRVPFTPGAAERTAADLFVSGQEDSGLQHVSFAGLADVTPNFFQTMGIALVRGRGIEAGDTADRAPVVVVNERAAAQLWPGRDPLGQQMSWGAPRPGRPSRASRWRGSSPSISGSTSPCGSRACGDACSASSRWSRCCSHRSASTASSAISCCCGRRRWSSGSRSAQRASRWREGCSPACHGSSWWASCSVWPDRWPSRA
jgi:putative ABC transport system permease protein